MSTGKDVDIGSTPLSVTLPLLATSDLEVSKQRGMWSPTTGVTPEAQSPGKLGEVCFVSRKVVETLIFGDVFVVGLKVYHCYREDDTVFVTSQFFVVAYFPLT